MRILIINSVCGIGSTGRICCEIAKEFDKKGFEVKVAYGRNSYVPDEYKKYAVRIGKHIDVFVHALYTRVFDRHGLGSIRATKKFIEWAKDFNPDIIWMHNLHGYYVNYQLLFAWLKTLRGVEIRWTLHDCWAFTGHCAFYDYVRCDKWRTGCFGCPQKKTYPTSDLMDNSKLNYIHKKEAFQGLNGMEIITPSEWLKTQVEQSFLSEYPINVKHNKIDTSIFRPVSSDFRYKFGLENKKIILGVANIWERRKGLDDFLELETRLNALNIEFCIILVGKLPKAFHLRSTSILYFDHTNNAEELVKIYSAADVLFNPTHEDNYPMVNLEAQSCGTPIITYNTGGCIETIALDGSRVVSGIEEAIDYMVRMFGIGDD